MTAKAPRPARWGRSVRPWLPKRQRAAEEDDDPDLAGELRPARDEAKLIDALMVSYAVRRDARTVASSGLARETGVTPAAAILGRRFSRASSAPSVAISTVMNTTIGIVFLRARRPDLGPAAEGPGAAPLVVGDARLRLLRSTSDCSARVPSCASRWRHGRRRERRDVDERLRFVRAVVDLDRTEEELLRCG